MMIVFGQYQDETMGWEVKHTDVDRKVNLSTKCCETIN